MVFCLLVFSACYFKVFLHPLLVVLESELTTPYKVSYLVHILARKTPVSSLEVSYLICLFSFHIFPFWQVVSFARKCYYQIEVVFFYFYCLPELKFVKCQNHPSQYTIRQAHLYLFGKLSLFVGATYLPQPLCADCLLSICRVFQREKDRRVQISI